MARSSATVTAIIITLLCSFLAGCLTHARNPTTYIVGDSNGWNLVVGGDKWAKDKKFYAGDILVFRYDNKRFNMLVVDLTGYETCTPNEGAIVYNSGEDNITLVYGGNYYIGTYNPLDCSTGMKMAINALAPS